MIIVTGASGKYGRGVVEALLQKVPAEQVGVSVRRPEKVQDLAERGVRVRQGSFEDPASLAHSFQGAEQVLVVSTDVMGEQGVAAGKAAVRAAVDAGASRVLYSSHMGAGHGSAFQACVDHAQVEDFMAGTGTPWTSLRNGFYAASALQFALPGVEHGVVALPADAPVNWTTHADLVEAAAAVLAGEHVLEGPTPALVSARAATFAEIAEAAAAASGHPVERVVVEDEEFVQQMIGWGTPEPVARQLLGMFVAARRDEFTSSDRTLEQVIGHPTGSVLELVREQLQG